ncbi:Putative two component Signal transduction histidine kinase (putative osmolarity sensor) [Methylocystis sp. SC2]|nr:Putative two component Signal transduction histidine kinase (putative osmolarity sensor) [Methylocystis sp. SC2]
MKTSALRNINVQLGLLLLLCVGLFHVAVTTILFLSEPAPGHPRDRSASIVVATLTALDAASAAERPAIAAALNANLPGFHVALSEPGVAARNGGKPVYFQSRLPVGVEIGAHDDNKRFSGSLHDGQQFLLDAPTRPPGFPRFAIITLGFVAVSLFVFSLWAALSLTRPLTNFADAAESFGLDSVPAQLAETGPEEVRKATRAFNRMQRRIAEMASQRTRMLTSVSHDLRTPITRMRLRAEYIESSETKAKLLRDLDQMEAMVGGCLDYLRGGFQQEVVALDLASLLQAIVDQFVDVGADARYEGIDRVNVLGSPDDLERAFSNLIDNAVKYGESPEVRLWESDDAAIVEIADRGPGIPQEKRDLMLEPFERGDVDASSNANAGFGLGLAIARGIVEAHGGRLTLDERTGGGLIARVSLAKAELETKRNKLSK